MLHRRSRFWINVVSVAAVIVFVFLCGLTIIWANGLKFNFSTHKFETTALISIESNLDNVNVYLNGELVANRTPLQLRQLKAGYYTVKITKDGYYDFTKGFQLASNSVRAISNLVLIAQNPTITTLATGDAPSYISYPTFDAGLSLSNGELFDGNKLVTRFSQDPVQIHRFNKGYVYQTGQEIRLYMPANNLDSIVYTLSSSDSAKILVRPNSWTVYIYEDNTVKQIEIVKPTAA